MESQMVYTQALGLEALAALVGTGDYLDGAELSLFQNDIDPTPTTPIGDYDVADYTGYGDEAVTWLAPAITDGGIAEVVGTAGEFRPTGTTVGNSVYGCLLKTAGGALVGACKFADGPYPMTNALDQILLTVRLRYSATGLIVSVT